MLRFVILAALVAFAQPAQAKRVTLGPDCAERLARSLAVLEDRSPLKEEHATGIMWLRLDAELALQAGDIETCEANLAQVELLLGIK